MKLLDADFVRPSLQDAVAHFNSINQKTGEAYACELARAWNEKDEKKAFDSYYYYNGCFQDQSDELSSIDGEIYSHTANTRELFSRILALWQGGLDVTAPCLSFLKFDPDFSTVFGLMNERNSLLNAYLEENNLDYSLQMKENIMIPYGDFEAALTLLVSDPDLECEQNSIQSCLLKNWRQFLEKDSSSLIARYAKRAYLKMKKINEALLNRESIEDYRGDAEVQQKALEYLEAIAD